MKRSLLRLTLLAMLAGLAACATGMGGDGESNPAETVDESRPPVTGTSKVDFLDRTFVVGFEDADGPGLVRQYFLPGDDRGHWREAVDFRVYPEADQGNTPLDFAKRTIQALKQRQSDPQFALYESGEGVALLDFFVWVGAEDNERTIEFNALKFFRDIESDDVIAFHYAKRLTFDAGEDVSDRLIALRERVIPAMAQFPLYRR